VVLYFIKYSLGIWVNLKNGTKILVTTVGHVIDDRTENLPNNKQNIYRCFELRGDFLLNSAALQQYSRHRTEES
jgi:hypothetical protein